jgi:hypothetical protein
MLLQVLRCFNPPPGGLKERSPSTLTPAHQFQSQLTQRQPQQDQAEEQVGQHLQHDQRLQLDSSQQQQDQRHQQRHVSHQLQQQQQPASSQHQFQSQLTQRQPQQDLENPLNLSNPLQELPLKDSLQELPQDDQSLQETEEEHPLGHPKNKMGCKRAKKIQQLERQVAQTTTELKKVVNFQSKVMSDAVDAAKLSMVDFFSDFRQQLIDSVFEGVYNRGDERRYVHGSVTAVRGGGSQENERINNVESQDDVDATSMEDQGDVICTAYDPAPTVAPSYAVDPFIAMDFSG